MRWESMESDKKNCILLRILLHLKHNKHTFKWGEAKIHELFDQDK